MEESAKPPIENQDDVSIDNSSPVQPQPSVQPETPAMPVAQSSDESPPKPRSKKAVFITLGIAFLLLVSCATFAVLQVMRNKIDNNPTADAKTTSGVQATSIDTASDAAITESLNGIDTGISSSSADQTSADSALSDSDEQISVPTE